MEYIECVTCNSKEQIKGYGTYRRSSDCKVVQRFYCKRCQKTFSRATIDPEYGQKKRRINHTVKMLLASGMSIRRTAIILNVRPATITYRLLFFGEQCRQENAQLLSTYAPIETIQFDELQTIEHSKCKPLSVAVSVQPKTRRILGFEVSVMPATGHLASISRQKYGYRPDKRREGLRTMFESIRPYIAPSPTFISDSHGYYPPLINELFSNATPQTHKGDPSAISGQGELKKRVCDPLFYSNHTLAMLRANVNRLIRKTWCTTKKIERLRDHLAIYVWVHNRKLIPQTN